MEIVQFYLQNFGSAIINNEYTAAVPTNALCQISWFPHNDLLINGEKINTDTIRQDQTIFLIIQIAKDKFLIRPAQTQSALGEITVTFEKGDIIIAGNHIINKKTNEYITADKVDILENDFAAVKSLHTKMGHTQIIKSNEQYTAREKSNHFIPQSEYDISLCFLECIRVKDFSTAEKLLSFVTNAEQIQNYFGKFEILPFFDTLYIYEPRKSGFITARKVNFEIKNYKIANFSLVSADTLT